MAHFSFEQAQDVLPEVRRLTAEAVQSVESFVERANLEQNQELREEIGHQIRDAIEKWANAVIALGAEVKGLWLVDFDSGEGYYCWKHPEESLEYFHTYEDGFAGRRLIAPTVLH